MACRQLQWWEFQLTQTDLHNGHKMVLHVNRIKSSILLLYTTTIITFQQGSIIVCCLLWPPCIADAEIIFLPCGFFYLPFSSPNLSGRRLDVYHNSTWCGLIANLGCISEMCCTQLTENTGCKNRHLRTIAQLCRAISLQLRHVSTIGKNLLNSNIFPTCPHNMVNFSPLAAEICW